MFAIWLSGKKGALLRLKMFGRTNFEDSVRKDAFHDSTINNMIIKNGTNTADDYFDFDFHLGQHQFFLFTDTYIKNPFMMIGQN